MLNFRLILPPFLILQDVDKEHPRFEVHSKFVFFYLDNFVFDKFCVSQIFFTRGSLFKVVRKTSKLNYFD